MDYHGYIIIGSRPYERFSFNEILDTFSGNCRCNLALPNNNNGTVCDDHIFNVHTYESVISNPLSLDNLIDFYRKFGIAEGYFKKFHNTFDKKKYKKIIRQDMLDPTRANNLLAQIDCPYRFTKQPRVGFNILFNKLIENIREKVYLTGFTIDPNEEVKNFYRSDKSQSPYHHKESEYKILVWLHMNGFIDASLCALEDKKSPTINCDLITPTNFIINLILEKHGDCLLRKTK